MPCRLITWFRWFQFGAMTTLMFDMLNCLYVLGYDHTARDASSWFAWHSWWVHHHIYSTQAAVPFVPAFSPTPQQHQPAGHTLPQPMQPPCATAAFAQPFSLQLNNNNTSLWDTPSHNQRKHHLPPLRLHNLHPFTLSTHHITTQPCQVFSHLIMSCSWNCKRLQ